MTGADSSGQLHGSRKFNRLRAATSGTCIGMTTLIIETPINNWLDESAAIQIVFFVGVPAIAGCLALEIMRRNQDKPEEKIINGSLKI